VLHSTVSASKPGVFGMTRKFFPNVRLCAAYTMQGSFVFIFMYENVHLAGRRGKSLVGVVAGACQVPRGLVFIRGFSCCSHVNQSIVATRASEILGMALLFALSRLELHYTDSRVALRIQTNNGLGFRRGPPGWIWIVLTHEYILMQRKDI
jgi:hypothetical protein